MRLPRVQFKIRTLMVAVVTTGTLLGVGIEAARLKSRSAYCRSRAADYATKEEFTAIYVEGLVKILADLEPFDKELTGDVASCSGLERDFVIAERTLFRAQLDRARKDLARYKARSDLYASMKSRYQLVSCRPWLAVPTDPKEPD